MKSVSAVPPRGPKAAVVYTRCHRGWARPCCQKRALRGRLCGSDCLCGGASGGSVPARGAPEQQHPLLPTSRPGRRVAARIVFAISPNSASCERVCCCKEGRPAALEPVK